MKPPLAFLANFLGLGLGYLYVGEFRLALAGFVSQYALIAFFAWTRLLVFTAITYWIACAVMSATVGIIFVHPTILAQRNRNRPLRPYNRWWLYLLWKRPRGRRRPSALSVSRRYWYSIVANRDMRSIGGAEGQRIGRHGGLR